MYEAGIRSEAEVTPIERVGLLVYFVPAGGQHSFSPGGGFPLATDLEPKGHFPPGAALLDEGSVDAHPSSDIPFGRYLAPVGVDDDDSVVPGRYLRACLRLHAGAVE